MDLYRTLDTFPEVPAMLKRVKAAGLKTAILSNGSPDMLDTAVNNAGIGDLLDAVLSVELVGVYKPHPKVYQLAVDSLAIPAPAISFQSSNAWDAYAASAFGMCVVWCNRYGQPPERLLRKARSRERLARGAAGVGRRLAPGEVCEQRPSPARHIYRCCVSDRAALASRLKMSCYSINKDVKYCSRGNGHIEAGMAEAGGAG